MQLHGLNCVCWEKNSLNFRAWEKYGLKYVDKIRDVL